MKKKEFQPTETLFWTNNPPYLSLEDIKKKKIKFELSFAYGVKNYIIGHQFKNNITDFGFAYRGEWPICLDPSLQNYLQYHNGVYFFKTAHLKNSFVTLLELYDAPSDLTENTNQPVAFTQAIPNSITVESLVDIIQNQQILFVIGAGASVGPVPDWSSLMRALAFDSTLSGVENFKNILRHYFTNPETFIENLDDIHHSFIDSSPLPVHWALKELAEFKKTWLATDNIDLLQQHTGIDVLKIKNVSSVSDEEPFENIHFDPLSVSAIICVGLAGDRRGLIKWYKKIISTGKSSI